MKYLVTPSEPGPLQDCIIDLGVKIFAVQSSVVIAILFVSNVMDNVQVTIYAEGMQREVFRSLARKVIW